MYAVNAAACGSFPLGRLELGRKHRNFAIPSSSLEVYLYSMFDQVSCYACILVPRSSILKLISNSLVPKCSILMLKSILLLLKSRIDAKIQHFDAKIQHFDGKIQPFGAKTQHCDVKINLLMLKSTILKLISNILEFGRKHQKCAATLVEASF